MAQLDYIIYVITVIQYSVRMCADSNAGVKNCRIYYWKMEIV